MNKVLVLGCSGSGKSTFSKQLAEIEMLPVIHLDSHYWKAGWVESTQTEWDQTVEELLRRDRYIMDGNYSRTIKKRMKDADTIFFFDYSRYLCIYRAVKRRVMNQGRTRSDMAEGCKEKIDWAFLKWIWNFKERSRAKMMSELEEARAAQKTVIIFHRPGDAAYYLAKKSIPASF